MATFPKPFSILFVIFLLHCANAQNLTTNFYRKTCRSLERTVWDTTRSFIRTTPGLAPSLLRMHFHDCFVRGCDGSVLINSTSTNTAEKDSFPNLSLRGFEVIDAVKTAVENKCPGRVSCADILALVARAAVLQIGGPFWPVPLGRRDGRVSVANETLTNLPPPFFNSSQLITSFASKGLNVQDLVVLSGGGHTIGVSHCSSFTARIYNFTGRGDSDPAMDPSYVATLKGLCQPNDTTTTVPMDPGSSLNFDTRYFTTVKNRRGLFQSDAALLNNNETNRYIQLHSNTRRNRRDRVFFKDFAVSMVKMGQIEVLTGNSGEIRSVCNKIN